MNLLNGVARAIEAGEIPLHLAVQLTPKNLRIAWARSRDQADYAILLLWLRPAELFQHLRTIACEMVRIVGLPPEVAQVIQGPNVWKIEWDGSSYPTWRVNITAKSGPVQDESGWISASTPRKAQEGSRERRAWQGLAAVADLPWHLRSFQLLLPSSVMSFEFDETKRLARLATNAPVEVGVPYGEVLGLLRSGAVPTAEEILEAARRFDAERSVV